MIKKVWVDFIMEIRPFIKFSLEAKFEYERMMLINPFIFLLMILICVLKMDREF